MVRRIDIAIIGAGPAGLTAAVYASRAKLTTVMFDKGIPGGQVLTTSHVENYPGFPDGISGPALAEAMEAQAKNCGAEIHHLCEVERMELAPSRKVVHTSDGSFEAGAVILASGASPNKLGAPGEERFAGKGVSYCATCDGAFFVGKRIAVVGGGDTALEDALYLSRIVERVTVVHRRDKLRAEKVLQERAFAAPNIDFLWNARVDDIQGDSTLERLSLVGTLDGAKTSLEVAGLFIAVGLKPNSDFIPPEIDLDDGYVVTDDSLATSVAGVYAAGDLRKNSLKQIAVAVGEAAVAATEAVKYIDEISWS